MLLKFIPGSQTMFFQYLKITCFFCSQSFLPLQTMNNSPSFICFQFLTEPVCYDCSLLHKSWSGFPNTLLFIYAKLQCKHLLTTNQCQKLLNKPTVLTPFTPNYMKEN